ncbi:NADPH-dependent FMN reductase [Streptococcus caviae]|uniref:NADPH-dependent FMN reductase n=1 Tax=Streptococcus sp. 'caviae' TaxID=1915004 RepID=UPI00094BB71A|nr:NAD(P)H-dependent oxidoreductase [Streptococcus sp. 'caviae']OLN82969.1 NADPH-dependent oxidoreductase [Streptococcus sp. 'caviae']
MKLLGIVDTSTSFSYNRLLMAFIRDRFGLAFDFELIEIEELPLFNQDESREQYPILQELTESISAADGIILAIEEHNHSLTPNLKSLLEWFSYQQSPFKNKPIMLVGASLNEHIPQKAQEDLKQILAAPGLKAWLMSDKPFFLKSAPAAFDENGQINEYDLITRLANNLQHFIRFIHLADSFTEK